MYQAGRIARLGIEVTDALPVKARPQEHHHVDSGENATVSPRPSAACTGWCASRRSMPTNAAHEFASVM